jgi:anoctamin-5
MSFFIESACEQPVYGGLEIDGTFEEFSEVLVMYGYAVMFAAVYPIAPLLCALLFIVELRVDCFKLFNIVQRPFPKSAAGIGAWKSIITVLSWLGLFSNALLLTYTFGVFQTVELREGERIPPEFAFFTFSVITISFKMAVAVMVPDEMASIPVVAARHQHLVQQLLGLSQTEAELMKSKAGKLTVKLSIDAPNSGQLRDPAEFGMLNGHARRMMSKVGARPNSHANAAALAAGIAAISHPS